MGVQLAAVDRQLAVFSCGVQLCEVALPYDMASGVGLLSNSKLVLVGLNKIVSMGQDKGVA